MFFFFFFFFKIHGGGCITWVPFVLHSDVDCVCVADEGEGWQLAVDVNFAGDNVDGWLAEASTAGELGCPVDGV